MTAPWLASILLSLDVELLVRRLKPEKHLAQLTPRRLDQHSADRSSAGLVQLVPDTNAYIHSAAGTLPQRIKDLLYNSLQFHCSVCLGELMAGVGAFDPRSARWEGVKRYYARLFETIPEQRILIPDAGIWTAAGMIAGMLARSQGFDATSRLRCLNDTLILLTAAKAGLPVLTADRDDFDLIQQTAGTGVFLYY